MAGKSWWLDVDGIGDLVMVVPMKAHGGGR